MVGWTYDAAGNLTNDGTATYSYDALNRMTARNTTSYIYNGDGMLVYDGTTRYTQDLASPLSQILQTTQGSATTNYLYGLDRLAAVAGSSRTWYGTDALGSVRLTLNDGGTPLGAVSYDPWGTPESGTVPTFGFTGELQDTTTGLVNLRARWYSTNLGRFTSVDPFAGFAQQPYSLHPYQYGYSDPVLLTDPSGRMVLVGDEGGSLCPGGWAWYDNRCVQVEHARLDHNQAERICGPEPAADPILGPPYWRCNQRTHEWEPGVIGGTVYIPGAANGIKAAVGVILAVCAGIATWVGIQAATSQPPSIAGNTAPNPPAPTPPPGTGNGKTLRLGRDELQYTRWAKDGYISESWQSVQPDESYFPSMFKEAAKNASRINFDIRGVDPRAAFAQGDRIIASRAGEGYGYTAWEFRTIMNTPEFFSKTIFYYGDRQLTGELLEIWFKAVRQAGFTIPG